MSARLVTGKRARPTLERLRCKLQRDGADDVWVDLERGLFIGKSASNDVHLAEPLASREHCAIVPDAHGYVLCDLNSTNGTLVDGAPVTRRRLEHGARITIAGAILQVALFHERVPVEATRADRFQLALGLSDAMRALHGLLAELVPLQVPVAFVGATGSGKRTLARSLHLAAHPPEASFYEVGVNGVSLQALLARQQAQPAAGSVYVREPVALSPSELQALADYLSPRRLRGPGEPSLRVLVGCAEPLDRASAAGRLPPELARSLSAVSLQIPPLHERPKDLRGLAETFLDAWREETGGASLTTVALRRRVLRSVIHGFEGNLHQLQAAVRAAAEAWVRADTRSAPQEDRRAASRFDPALSYRETRARADADFERRYVTWLLNRHDGNVSAAAREACMDRKFLHRLIQKVAARDPGPRGDTPADADSEPS